MSNHILYPKALHNAQTPSKELRNNRWLIVPLEHEPHNELHRQIGIVPVMSWLMEGRVARDFYPHPGDYAKSVENLAKVVFEVTQQRNVSHLERELGLLVVESLELQLEYIEPSSALITET